MQCILEERETERHTETKTETEKASVTVVTSTPLSHPSFCYALTVKGIACSMIDRLYRTDE